MTIEELIADWVPLRQAQRISSASKKNWKIKREISKLSNTIKATEKTNLSDIKWIWPATIQILLENNIKAAEDLKVIPLDEIKKLVTSPIALKSINKILNK